MKARELIFDLRRTVVPVVSAQKAATMLERFIALADGLNGGNPIDEGTRGWSEGLEHAAKRIREILEEA